MSGYPDRPARVAFGPTMQNKRTPKIPEKDLSAEQVNLDFWQIAGAGRVLPMALILFDGATPSILYQALAFDPKQELGDLAFVKNGTGDYTFSFNSTYPNQVGNARPFVPRMSMAMVQGGAMGTRALAAVPAAQDVQVQVRNAADALTDATFVLAVW